MEEALPGAPNPPLWLPIRAALAWTFAWKRLPAILMLLALVGATSYAFMDGRFYVHGAGISGAGYFDSHAVYQSAGIEGMHIFWVRPEEVEEKILQLGGVKSVDVHSGLPAAITIELEERKPIVLLRSTSQERDWWLDDEGIVLPYHGDPHSDEVVFIIDASERQLRAGEAIKPVGLVTSAVRLASALPGTRLFYFQEDRGLSFTQEGTQGDYPVYIGTSDDLARKIQVLKAISGYLETKRIRPAYVDVRWADRPVYGTSRGKSKGRSQ